MLHSKLRRLGAVVIALTALAGCMPEIDNTIIADPADIRAYEGFWINAKGDTAQLLGITPDDGGRRARVRFVSLDRTGPDVSWSTLTVQATKIGDMLYFEAGNADAGGNPKERFIGRFHAGTTETPDDRDKLTVCVTDNDFVKGPVEQDKLKGTVTRDRASTFSSARVRITASTDELRGFLAATPLQCGLFNSVIYVRAKEHYPSSR